ncbi:MAG: phosphohistidine phosphatase SixA [Anaerolineales bacterium]
MPPSRLYFLRHGLADRDAWRGPDFERPLTPQGIARIQAEAATLAAMKLRLDCILSSPLVRARQTAEIVAQALHTPMKIDARMAPISDIETLESILRAWPQADALMLVGHEPGLSLTIGALIGGGRVVCKKGMLARVDLTTISPPRGELVWLLPSKILASESDEDS